MYIIKYDHSEKQKSILLNTYNNVRKKTNNVHLKSELSSVLKQQKNDRIVYI